MVIIACMLGSAGALLVAPQTKKTDMRPTTVRPPAAEVTESVPNDYRGEPLPVIPVPKEVPIPTARPSAAPPASAPPPPAQEARSGITLAGAPASPAPPSAEEMAAILEEGKRKDTDCRDKMRKLGVVSTGPCIDVGAIVNDLAEGTYVFNKPRSAYVGEPFRLLLALKTAPQQDVKQSFIGLAGEIAERPGKIAQSLEASLRADDLKVEPAAPQVRTVTTTNAVEWDWMLIPQSGGVKTLVIEVMANIEIGPDRHKVQVRTLREPILIYVSIFQRVSMYVAQANGVILAASATITAIAGVIGLVPPIRRYLLRIWRRVHRRNSARPT